MRLVARLASTIVALAVLGPVAAQDVNLPLPVAELEQMLRHEPLRIVAAEISRPKAKGDITLKAEVAFGDRPPLRVKLRKAVPGGEEFNNVPRYDLAAYELQKLFIDPAEYVVPPTALRMIPLADFRQYSPDVLPTFRESAEVLAVVQAWLQQIKVIADVFDPALFETDAVYARHIGQLNVLTHAIAHGDSNVGNFLISRATTGPRVFSIDHGVAFASAQSDRGKLWQVMRVNRLPADTVARLRALTDHTLHERLGVLAQWQLQDGRYVAVPADGNLSPQRGIRREDGILQMGLTRSEIGAVWRRLSRLLKEVDAGRIETY
ncbi:MAG: hypothetical protein WBO04_14505 [Steroidobacteraceae bacterium]